MNIEEAIEILSDDVVGYAKGHEKYEEAVKTLLTAYGKQSKEIEELKNADLTTVYLNGVYDGENKVKDKIKARIEELEEYSYKGNIKDDFLMIIIKAKIQELQSLLEKE